MVTNLQIFGSKKCKETQKAERFFKERRMSFQRVDLGQKAMSPGELRNVAAKVGGMEALIDRQGRHYEERGLKYSAPTGPRIEQALVDDPLLIKTPVIRCSAGATVGFVPDVWLTWLGG